MAFRRHHRDIREGQSRIETPRPDYVTGRDLASLESGVGAGNTMHKQVLRTAALLVVAVGALLALATTSASAQTGEVRVEIFASGSSGAERIELRLDGQTVAQFDVTTDLREYSYTTTRRIGPSSLAVHFVNDASVAEGDRAVLIDRVVVNDEQFQTESSSVDKLGAWSNGSCKRVVTTNTESLTCNGYARYAIGDAGTPRVPPSTPAPASTTPLARVGHNGEVGCVENCQTVGFLDFDGKRDHIVENLIISNPGGPCLSLRGAHNITIRNVTLQNCGTQANTGVDRKKIVNITASSNITITNTKFVNNASRAVSNHDLIKVHNSADVTIVNNEIRNLASATNETGPDSGNRAILVTGNQTSNLVITRNSFYSPGRNAVQISRARRIPGVKITHNRIEGRGPWDSDFEDMINFFATTGHPDDPILVRKNYLRNGGPSDSGTAIILGDGRDGLGTGNIRVVENIIVDPGHVGINIVSGFNFTVKNNIIYGGTNVGLWTSTGLVVHHQRYTPACRDHAVYGNRVYFRNQYPQHDGTNHEWIPGTCTNNVRVHSNTFGDTSLSYAVWDLN